jgi:hypothetical protein
MLFDLTWKMDHLTHLEISVVLAFLKPKPAVDLLDSASTNLSPQPFIAHIFGIPPSVLGFSESRPDPISRSNLSSETPHAGNTLHSQDSLMIATSLETKNPTSTLIYYQYAVERMDDLLPFLTHELEASRYP